MPITPIDPPRPIAQPAIAPIVPPSPQGGREGGLRVVVWFRAELGLPDDEIACDPDTADTLFGPGVAQRLLITPETAWLHRLLPGTIAAALDESTDRGADGTDVLRSTPYSHIYLFRLTGGLGVDHVCDVLGASANVRLVYPEPVFTATAAPTQYKNNQVFINDQAYLKTPQGINAEPVWAKGYTGAGVQAGVVDMVSDFTGLPYKPRIVAAVNSSASAPGSSSAGSTHGRDTTGILGCPDNGTIGIGAAPEVTIVFSPVNISAMQSQTASGALADVTAAFSALMINGQLNAGDVVNVSLGVTAGLDIKQPYQGYAALVPPAANPVAPYKVMTETVGGDTRASGVVTQQAIEFVPCLFKFVADFTRKGITVVEAAGNGLSVLCEPKGSKDPAWVIAKLGADLSGPWRAGQQTIPLAQFRKGLAKTAAHSLDRASTAAFADAGGIVVSGGQFSPSRGGMIANIQLNHGNRVDCYVDSPAAQALGFAGSSTAAHRGGTSLCAPAIAGAAAVVQGIVRAQFKQVLLPAILRALLSDPDLGTVTLSGSPVGVMPDLAKLMAFLEKPLGKPDDLLKAVQAQQQKSAARVKAAAAGSFTHDPYTSLTGAKGSGSWQPLKLSDSADLFFSAPP